MSRHWVVVALLVSSASAGEYANSDVIEADTAKFEELRDGKGGTLVTFYAPWCGHCVKMVPEFKRCASMLKSSGVKTAAVNSDANPGLAQSLGIRGFPTVRFMGNGGMSSDYKGPREAMDLLSFALQQATVFKLKRVGSAVVGAAKSVSKLAMSKVLGSGRQPPPPPQQQQQEPAPQVEAAAVAAEVQPSGSVAAVAA